MVEIDKLMLKLIQKHEEHRTAPATPEEEDGGGQLSDLT